ncbi:MAG: VWA domain-containing protein [Nanoarchaeota archaeon]
MVDVVFTNPSYLWILLLVPVLIIIHLITLKQSRGAIIKFANFEAIERVAKGNMLGKPYQGILKNKNFGLLLIRALVYCLLILSAAGTTLWYVGNASDFDYVIAIDGSTSMLANDLDPNRFEAAKESALIFTSVVPKGASIGIITFASTSVIESRLSSDIENIRKVIQDLQPHESGGTAIGDAIITSTNLFNTNKSKVIILLTDGQSNVGVPPETAVEYAKQNRIAVHTIAVATQKGGKVSELDLISKPDEDLLKGISSETNAKFFRVNTTETLVNSFKEIASSTEKTLSVNISWMLLVGAIVLLGLEWIFINTIYKTIP